jgi:ABC-type bacteriocin/lantibiotic exporter with double-glycine peptidase domain
MTCSRRSIRIGIVCVMQALAGLSVRADPNPLCGPECLYTALLTLKVDPGNYADFLDKVGDVDARGTSLGRLAELAAEYGVSTLAVETSLENLRRRQAGPPFACIAHVDGDHFVLIGAVEDKAVWTINPPGEGLVAAPAFAQRWNGQALLLSLSPLVPEEQLPAPGTRWLSWAIAIAAGAVLMVGVWKLASRARSAS